jgi:hypothetical protein
MSFRYVCGNVGCANGCMGMCVPAQQLPAKPAPGGELPSYRPYVPVRGCICPPGANKDCESSTCPRKDLLGIMAEKRQV